MNEWKTMFNLSESFNVRQRLEPVSYRVSNAHTSMNEWISNKFDQWMNERQCSTWVRVSMSIRDSSLSLRVLTMLMHQWMYECINEWITECKTTSYLSESFNVCQWLEPVPQSVNNAYASMNEWMKKWMNE